MSDGSDDNAVRAQAGRADPGAAAQAERASLAELYRRFQPEIVNYIRRFYGRGPPDPEDAAQAAFAHFAAAPNAAAIANPRAFLYRCARNYVIDQRRKESVRARNAAQVAVEDADQIDAERVLSARQRVEILSRALQAMEARRREALVMYKMDGLTFAEIAARMGISQTWAKRLVADALIECDRAMRKAEGE